MSYRPHRGLRAALVAVASSAVVLAAAPTTEQGLVYDFSVSGTSASDGKSRDVVGMQGHGQVTPSGDARVDLVSTQANGNPMLSKDGYVIVRGGTQMLMVDPKEKRYFAFNLEQMMAGMGSMMKAAGPMLKMTMSDVAVNVTDLGAGGKLEGYDTRHLRMTQSYAMTLSVLGRKQSTTSADTIDYWIAPALKHVANPFLRMGSSVGAMLDFTNSDYASQLAAANAKLAIGLPLKAVTRSVAVDGKGKQQVTTSTMAVTNLRAADIPSSVFVIPANYQEVEMPFAQLSVLGDSLDAARARDARTGAAAKPEIDAKAAAKAASEEAAKETTKSKLRKLIRKP